MDKPARKDTCFAHLFATQPSVPLPPNLTLAPTKAASAAPGAGAGSGPPVLPHHNHQPQSTPLPTLVPNVRYSTGRPPHLPEISTHHHHHLHASASSACYPPTSDRFESSFPLLPTPSSYLSPTRSEFIPIPSPTRSRPPPFALLPVHRHGAQSKFPSPRHTSLIATGLQSPSSRLWPLASRLHHSPSKTLRATAGPPDVLFARPTSTDSFDTPNHRPTRFISHRPAPTISLRPAPRLPTLPSAVPHPKLARRHRRSHPAFSHDDEPQQARDLRSTLRQRRRRRLPCESAHIPTIDSASLAGGSCRLACVAAPPLLSWPA